MKKTNYIVKRAVSVLCLLAVIFTTLPFMPTGMKAGAASHNVEEAMSWCEGKVGQTVGSGQCVAFVQAYYNYLGAATVSGHAYQYSTNSLPSGWSRVQGGVPQRGDILVYTGATYGHVVIYAGGTTVYQQNWNGKYVEKSTNWSYNKSWYSNSEGGTKSYWGYIRPDFTSPAAHVVNSSYPKNFAATARIKIQPLTDGNHNTQSNRWIDAGDQCIIKEVYTDGCCLVDYPSSASSTGRNQLYCKFNSTNFSYSLNSYSLSFSTSSVSLKKNGSTTVNISFSGDGINTLYFSESDDSICSPSWGDTNWSAGTSQLKITGDKAGTTTVTVGLKDSSGNVLYSKSFTVTVIPPTYTLSFSTSSVSLKKNESTTVNISFSGDGINTLYFSESDDSICSPSWGDTNWSAGTSQLKITGDKAGTTTVTIGLKDSSGNVLYSKSFTVTVQKDPCTLSFSPSSVSVKEGASQAVTINFSGDGIYRLSYSISDTGKCSASWGNTDWSSGTSSLTVTGKSAGSTTVTINLKDSSDNILYSKSFNVTVSSTSYTVTYNANGGTGAPSAQTVSIGSSATIPSTVPTKVGYRFLGWSTSSSAAAPSYRPNVSFTPTSNTLLYAVWDEASTASVNSSLSAQFSFKNQVYYYKYTPSVTAEYCIYPDGTYDTNITLYNSSGTKLTDNGSSGSNSVLSYYLSSGSTYYFGIKYVDDVPQGSIIVRGYKFGYVNTVTFNANGGSGAPSSQKKYYATDLTLSAVKPTRSGYNFVGWAKNSSAITADYQPGSTFTLNANTTLYAVWKEKPSYTITYNANGGSGAPSPQYVYEGSSVIVSSVKPTRNGYTFLGWATTSSASSATYTAGMAIYPSGNVTLYAVWKIDNTRVPGDVNNDGKVTTMDATLIKRKIVGGFSITVFNEANADVNGDGKVTTMDATLIKRYIVGGYGVVLK